MSGPMCPECNLLALEEAGKSKMKCPICGWEGEMPPSKILTSQMGSSLWEETQEKLKLRKSGKLFYYRIYLEGTDEQKSIASFDIMGILGLNHMMGSGRLLFHLPEKMNDKQLGDIKKIKAVKRIEVF